MLLGGVVAQCFRRVLAVVDEVVRPPLGQGLVDPGLEIGDIGRRVVVPGEAPEVAQIVGQAAAADHQHAVPAQGRKRPPQRQVMGRAPGRLHRELDDRDLGLRPGHLEGRPGAVVKAALAVEPGLETRLAQDVRRPLGQIGVARRRIA